MAKKINPNTGFVDGPTSDNQGGGPVKINPATGWVASATNAQQKPVRPSQPVGSDTIATPGGGKKKVKG